MSNIFKSNSRFAALAEETPNIKEFKKDKKKKEDIDKKSDVSNENNSFKREENSFKREENSFKREGNSFKSERPYYDRNQRNYYTNKLTKEQIEKNEEEEKLRQQLIKEAKEKKIAEDMAPENFPDLVKPHEIYVPKMDYKKFINNETAIDNEVKNKNKEDEVPPGWCMMQYDKKTHQTIYKYGKPTYIEREKTEREIGIDVLNALVSLHEKRTKEYIDNYGYDEWERMFRFPNYDYNWVDKLDEEYEEYMAELEQDDEEEEDYITDRDRHENYWKH